MSHPHNGSLVAAFIQFEADQIKREGDREIQASIRRHLSAQLEMEPESIPDDAIRPFKRIRRPTPQDEGFRRASEVIEKLLQFRMFGEVPDQNETFSIVERVYEECDLLLSRVHGFRLQASFVRAVCRPLYLAWLMDVFGLDAPDEVERRFVNRRKLLAVHIESPEHLHHWAEEIFDFFESVNRQASDEAKKFSLDSFYTEATPKKVRGVVSESSVRLYRRTWNELVESRSVDIWNSSGIVSSAEKIPTQISREMDFDSLPNHSNRGLAKSARTTSDWNKRAIARSMGITYFDQTSQAQSSPPYRASLTQATPDSSGLSEAFPNKVRIEIIEEGSSGFTIPLEWNSIQEALSEIERSLKPIVHIIGKGQVDRAKISVGQLKSDNFEIADTTIDTVINLFVNFLQLRQTN